MKKHTSLLLLGLALLGLTLPASGQQIRKRAWTNVPAIVTTVVSSNIAANPFVLQRDKGVGVLVEFNGTNAGTGNLVIEFELSPDGTNWITTKQFNFVSLQNGTTRVLNWSNLITGDPVRFNNIYQIRPKAITNSHTASLFPSNIWWTYNSD